MRDRTRSLRTQGLGRGRLAEAHADLLRASALAQQLLMPCRGTRRRRTAESDALQAEAAKFAGLCNDHATTLTKAELRLLPFLTTHLSMPEIAEQLFVSRDTVKSQAITLSRKLDASGRSAALARVVELGLTDAQMPSRPAQLTFSGRPGLVVD